VKLHGRVPVGAFSTESTSKKGHYRTQARKERVRLGSDRASVIIHRQHSAARWGRASTWVRGGGRGDPTKADSEHPHPKVLFEGRSSSDLLCDRVR
jgi:hypothetical protein